MTEPTEYQLEWAKKEAGGAAVMGDSNHTLRPRLAVFSGTTADPFTPDYSDAHGRWLVIKWLGFIIELGIGKVRT